MSDPRRASTVRAACRRPSAWAIGAAAWLAATIAVAESAPQYGGTLTTTTVNPTVGALTWDHADWNWKYNQDDGQVYDQLFVADLTQSRRLGGKHAFTIDAWLPPDAIRGELAESWQWKDNPLRVEIKLRRGVMFPDKPGVMKARELTSDDVVYSFERINKSPRKLPGYFDHVDGVDAPDRHTVVFRFKQFNAEWDYRFGWGYYSAVFPREVVEAGMANWRHANGTGPFMLTDVTAGVSHTYERNGQYWDSLRVGGSDYKLPFVDRLVYRLIKDESTRLAAFRTGKIDLLEAVRGTSLDELKRSAPAIRTSRWLNPRGSFLALRVDTKPFDDVRVRRALNMAVDKREIIQSFYRGDAELLGYPQHPDFGAYYEPLDTMPDSVKELFAYDPDKARRLLAEAGYPNGLRFKIQYCVCNPHHEHLAPVLLAYLARVGVMAELQPMEYAAYLSVLTTKTHAAGYLMENGHTNPTTTLRKNFASGQTFSPSLYADPAFDQQLAAIFAERDDAQRQRLVRAATREILDKAPYVWLPTLYLYSAWWPWVKHYDGELRAGAERPGPIYARIWIDQALKKQMGY